MFGISKKTNKMKTRQTKSGIKIINLLAGRSNVFLLSNNNRYIIIDTSTRSNWKKLDKRLHKLNISKLDYLILTHTHYDHAENALKIREKYKALLIVHNSEASCITNGEVVVPKGTNIFTKFIIKILAKSFANNKIVKCPYDILVDSIYDLKEMGFNAYIMHTPGHTPGSMSVIVDDEIAIVGDTMFGVFKWSAFPPYAYDTKQIIESWVKLLNTKCYLFLPSHGTADSRQLLQKEYEKRKALIV